MGWIAGHTHPKNFLTQSISFEMTQNMVNTVINFSHLEIFELKKLLSAVINTWNMQIPSENYIQN